MRLLCFTPSPGRSSRCSESRVRCPAHSLPFLVLGMLHWITVGEHCESRNNTRCPKFIGSIHTLLYRWSSPPCKGSRSTTAHPSGTERKRQRSLPQNLGFQYNRAAGPKALYMNAMFDLQRSGNGTGRLSCAPFHEWFPFNPIMFEGTIRWRLIMADHNQITTHLQCQAWFCGSLAKMLSRPPTMTNQALSPLQNLFTCPCADSCEWTQCGKLYLSQ